MSNIVFVFLLLLAAILLVGITRLVKEKRRKRNEIKLARTYEQLLLRHRLAVDHSEIISERVIALDRRSQRLLFLDLNTTDKPEMCLSLTEVAAVKVVKEEAKDGSIQKVCLELRNKKKAIIHRFCFFSAEADKLTALPSLWRRATQWKHRIEINRHLGNTRAEGEYVL